VDYDEKIAIFSMTLVMYPDDDFAGRKRLGNLTVGKVSSQAS
jgi:hypothetical protein